MAEMWAALTVVLMAELKVSMMAVLKVERRVQQ
jgi:hypothetical protein